MAEEKEEKRTTIRLDVTEEEKELVARWQELLSFSSQREMVKFFLMLGVMSAEMVVGQRIDPGTFANALYTVGSRVLQGEFTNNTRRAVEDFKRWRQESTSQQAQTYQVTRELVDVSPSPQV